MIKNCRYFGCLCSYQELRFMSLTFEMWLLFWHATKCVYRVPSVNCACKIRINHLWTVLPKGLNHLNTHHKLDLQ